MSRRRPAGLALVMLALASASATAQVDPRLTGSAIIEQLETAQRDVTGRAASSSPDIATAAAHLGEITQGLRKMLGNDAGKPIVKLGDEANGRALHAYAAAQQAQTWLASSSGCTDGDTEATAAALSLTLLQISMAKDSGKPTQPVIYALESTDHRALFAVNGDARDVALAVTGVNLNDAQCEDPLVSATDEKGVALAAQPVISSVLPNRIEMKLAGEQKAGGYLLHVVPKRKVRLLGCSTQPEAVVAFQVVQPVRYTVAYSVTTTCRARATKKGSGESRLPAVNGLLPELSGNGATVSQQVALAACDDPLSYSISATATATSGAVSTFGPISQSAAAGITAGMPGGLSLSWDPTVHSIFGSLSPARCKGVY